MAVQRFNTLSLTFGGHAAPAACEIEAFSMEEPPLPAPGPFSASFEMRVEGPAFDAIASTLPPLPDSVDLRIVPDRGPPLLRRVRFEPWDLYRAGDGAVEVSGTYVSGPRMANGQWTAAERGEVGER